MSKIHPRDTDDAQYNIAFPIAAALIDGEVGPRQVFPPRLFDADILELVDKVHCITSIMNYQRLHLDTVPMNSKIGTPK